MDHISRRTWLKDVSAAGAGSVLAGNALGHASQSATPQTLPPNGTIVPRTSTHGVFVPPRGRTFQKFSFDFPEPSVAFEGYEFGFRVFTHENVYSLSSPHLTTSAVGNGLEIACTEMIWAGGQQRASGRLTARLTASKGLMIV